MTAQSTDQIPMLAVVPVRGGVLPLGALETIAECGGRALVIGSGCREAAERIGPIGCELWLAERDGFVPAAWAETIAAVAPTMTGGLHGGHWLLPASPDGRDLGPHLAIATQRRFVAGTIRLDETAAHVTRHGGRVTDVLSLDGPVVATLQPGVRGTDDGDTHGEVTITDLTVEHDGATTGPTLLEELPADPSTMDLAEADRIIGGGAGLGSPEAFDEMRELAAMLGASPGGTRVVTDWGWLPVARQIGTTGVTVDPSLYIALGISGAVQHTAGLGSPDHVICVNTDPHCPMMGLADLAVVTDGPEFLRELAALLATLDQ